jgi:hypothetical protein
MSGPLALVYPLLTQVFWTFVVYILLGVRRQKAFAGGVRRREIALDDGKWPDEARKVSNNLRNQFESPVLFYVLCGVATYLGITPIGMTILAWVYVASRVVHTFVHTGANVVNVRGLVFAIGATALFIMWVVIVFRLLVA